MAGRSSRSRGMMSIYGRSRIWRRRRDGHWQRYWTTTRFDLIGTRAQLARAHRLIRRERLTPRRRFIRADARRFVMYPGHYSMRGRWRYDVEYRMERRRRRRRRRRR